MPEALHPLAATWPLQKPAGSPLPITSHPDHHTTPRPRQTDDTLSSLSCLANNNSLPLRRVSVYATHPAVGTSDSFG